MGNAMGTLTVSAAATAKAEMPETTLDFFEQKVFMLSYSF
jgi:hypothetical protein